MKISLLAFFLTLSTYAVDVINISYPTAHSGVHRTKIRGNSFFHSSVSNYNSNDSGRSISFDAKSSKGTQVIREGFYRVEANVRAPSGSANSFFVKVNDQFPKRWNIPVSTATLFRTVYSEVYLKKGENKILFAPRENYTQVADVRLTYVRSLSPAYSEYFNRGIMPAMERARNPHLLSLVSPGALRAQYQMTPEGSARVLWEKSLAAANQYTLTYRVKFHEGFDFARGGKIHGVGPRAILSGCQPGRTDGWSNRVNFGPGGKAYIYLYRQDRPNRCGEAFYGAGTFRFQTNRWYTVALYTKVNSTAHSSDGEAKLYIDGKQIVHEDGIRFRGEVSSRSAVNKFLFSTFHGGADSSYSPRQDGIADFDGIRVIRGDFPGQ